MMMMMMMIGSTTAQRAYDIPRHGGVFC